MSQFLSSFNEGFVPGSTYQDPVEKLRVSMPQAMIDTDFEYSLQASKWESVGMINNVPSVFVKANEPFLSGDQISRITPLAASGSVFTSITAPTDRARTGLTQVHGTANSDEVNVGLTVPWSVTFLGNSYQQINVNGNSWLSFGVASTASFVSADADSPNVPTIHIGSNSYPGGGEDGNVSYIGYETYTDAFWGVSYRVRFEGNNSYSGVGINKIWDVIFPQNNPATVLICLRTPFTYNATYEFLAVSSGEQFIAYQVGAAKLGTDLSYSWSSPLITTLMEVTTVAAHGRSVGQPIIVKESSNETSVDGAYLVTQVPTSTTFRYIPRRTAGLRVLSQAATYSRTGTAVTVTTSTSHGYRIGQSVFVDATSGALVDGIYEVAASPAPTATTFAFTTAASGSTSGNATLTQEFRTPYTSIYTGGFFDQSDFSVNTIDRVNSTTRARVTMNYPHGMFVGSPIYVIDTTQPTADHVGGFYVDKVNSNMAFEYTTRAVANYSSSAQLSTGANSLVYSRPEGTAIHRSADGGVQINPGSNAPNAQIIRQTRKYFRYQSGKGVQFSTGALLKPVYDVNNILVDATDWASNGNYLVCTVTTEQEHGLASPFDSATGVLLGATVRLRGFTVSSGINPYNASGLVVKSVPEPKKIVVWVPAASVPADTTPGGLAQVDVTGWTDALTREGLFDEQNGVFWEFDGTKLFAVKRSSTTSLSGNLTAVRGSSTVYGTNTKFLSQLSPGDYIVIRGMSHAVVDILSDTELVVAPRYRGVATAFQTKALKTVETRVESANFSIDPLDGTGPSGYTLDPNKMQMFFIDYSWYGAGKIRWGIRTTDGKITYVHEAPQNNVNTEAWIRSGNLPGRFEIMNKSKRTSLTAVTNYNAVGTWSSTVNSTTFTITSNGHGLATGDNLLLTFTGAGAPSSITYNVTVTDADIFTITATTAAKSTTTGSVTINFAMRSATAVPFNLSVADASEFPSTGTVMVNQEYMKYTKTNSTTLSITYRNRHGRTANANASKGETIFSVNQNCAPALSHWGTSVIMDGQFDEDKSYLFTGFNTSSVSFSVASQAQKPMMSIRLSPSVDLGIPRDLGIRNLINRSMLTLKTCAVFTSNHPFIITLKINPESTAFQTYTNWTYAGNGSIAQYMDHGAVGISGTAVTGGDTILTFYAEQSGVANVFSVTDQDIVFIRELGNGILGGSKQYPDGPDILTIFAQPALPIASGTASAYSRVSWTEAQG